VFPGYAGIVLNHANKGHYEIKRLASYKISICLFFKMSNNTKKFYKIGQKLKKKSFCQNNLERSGTIFETVLF